MLKRKKKNFISKLLLILMIIMALLSYMPENISPVLDKADAADNVVQSNMSETLSYMKESSNVLNDWESICSIKGAGANIQDKSWILPEWNTSTIAIGSSASIYGSKILALVAMNKNPEDIWGRNLINELVLKQDEATGSFGTLLDQVYAMHALKLADADYNENLALDWLLKQQNFADGGFGFSEVSDLDITGIVLRLLANYKLNTDVQKTISDSLVYIKKNQLDSGGFKSNGKENSNTIAVLISGLTSVGEDVQSASWEKNGKDLVDALNQFKLSDGSYKWLLTDTSTNKLATLQSLEALGDIIAGNSILNRLDYTANKISVDLRIEGITETKYNKQVSYIGYPNPTVKDVLEYALSKAGISYEITDSSWGLYLNSIDGETAGKFGGYDGWLYLKNGSDGSGIGIDKVEEGDRLVFYYGEYAPGTLIPKIEVSSESIYEGDDITFTVTSTYVADWNTNTTTTAAIEGALIEIADKSYTTDSKGKVTIAGSTLSAGEYVYKVSKNVKGAVPGILRTDGLGLKIKPLAKTSVKLRIEGISETKYNKQVSYIGYPNPTVKDVLEYALSKAGISYEITDSSWGLYLNSIDGETAGKFGGYDGWLYLKNGSDGSGIGIDKVEEGDRLVFYYGEYAPGTLIPKIEVSSESIYEGDDITFTVTSTYVADWNTNTTTTAAIEGALIEIADKSYTTDSKGKVTIAGSTLSAGEYVYKVSKNVKGAVPGILRTDLLGLTIKNKQVYNNHSTPNQRYKVNVAVMGKDGEVIYGPKKVYVSTEDEYGTTALSALDATSVNYKFGDNGGYGGLFVEEIDGQKNEGMNGWMYAVNGNNPGVSSSIKNVNEGDKVLWWYSMSAMGKAPEWPDSTTKTTKITDTLKPMATTKKVAIDVKKKNSFIDVDDNISWARNAIEVIAGNGIINGTGIGFEPHRSITRAEFIKIIVKALDIETKKASGNVFKDVDRAEWFADFVEVAFENKIISGDQKGNFKPNDFISRNEIALILSRINNNQEILESFDSELQDAGEIPEWAKDGVEFALKAKLMNGYNDNTFRGTKPITRAEAAVVVYRYLTKLKD